MNFEGWSNEAGLGISSNRQEDGFHVSVVTLGSSHLGLRQAIADKAGTGLRDGSLVVAASQHGR